VAVKKIVIRASMRTHSRDSGGDDAARAEAKRQGGEKRNKNTILINNRANLKKQCFLY
jgi:hypothetical protein